MPDAMKLPAGATLVGDPSQGMKLPPGASLVSGAPSSIDQQPAPVAEPGFGQRVGSTVSDLAAGAAQGLGSSIHSTAHWLHENVPPLRAIDDVYWKMRGQPTPTEEHWNNLTEPQNTAQRIGKIGEQAAEFLIPGGAEEQAGKFAARLAPKVPMLAPLARTATAALGSGLVNKTQGGDFSSGAAMGGVGGLIGEGARGIAPKVAEAALGIRKMDRFYGRTPGAAILDETKGLTPGKVAESARAKMADLTSQLGNLAASSKAPANMLPARSVVDDAIQTAQRQNNPKAIAQLKPMAHQLSTNVTSGLPLASNQSATGLLNLKQGFGDSIATWNPEITKTVNDVGKRAYHALDQEFDKAVPGAADINQRVSSLIPVAKRAEAVDHGAGIVQRGIHRVAAHTGAGIAGVAGGKAGYDAGGLPGMVAGGLAGIAVPEMLVSPTTLVGAARTAYSPLTQKVVRPLIGGSLLQSRNKAPANNLQR